MRVGTVQTARAIAERAEENFPSKAYGPHLEAQGFASLLARGLGSLTISLGKREADEAKSMAPVVEAIRFLARGDRQKRAILSRAKLVLAARTIAAAVAPSARSARGAKITAASAAHELFLEMSASFGLPGGYTRSGIDGEYTDPRTQATRQEFDDRDFDPRPAHRRVKRRGLVKTRVPFADSISDNILLLGSLQPNDLN
jgi:hypothetical protein